MNLNAGYMKNLAGMVAATNPGWFKKWFDSSFYHQLYAHRNEKEASDFIDSLLGTLEPAEHARMLDLGCGAGRHSKYLASKGYQVTGLDLAASSIIKAKRYETDSLRFFQHDMRIAFGKNYFDYVFNFFTSFGYFDSDAENAGVIQNMVNSLKPGGILMMDYLNVSFAEQHIVAQEEKEIDGITYQISRWMDEKHFFKKIKIFNLQADGPLEYTEKVAKLRLADFQKLFDAHHLRLEDIHGDYQLNDFQQDHSPRLILIAKNAA